MQKINSIYLILIFVLGLTACTEKTAERPPEPEPEPVLVKGVSTWDRISARSEPRRSSKTITLLSLGESFTYLDTFAIDSAYKNTKFLKARLSDSSEVWLYGFACALDAEPAAVVTEVPLYMRPDLLTITESSLAVMEIVAVLEDRDDWIRVVNEKNVLNGWVRKDVVSYNNIDLAMALLAKRKLDVNGSEEKIKNLEELLANNPYSASVFTSELQVKLQAEKDSLKKRDENWFWGDQNRKRQ